MNRQQVIDKLRKVRLMDDTDIAHIEADDLLCEFLKSLGYQDVVDAYKAIKKWYS